MSSDRVALMSRILLLSLPIAVFGYPVTEVKSLAKFKQEYNSNFNDVHTGATPSSDVLAMNNRIRGSTEPTDADQKKLWAWYSEVDGTAKAAAKTFLEKVEKDNLIHEQLLTNFNTQLNTALVQGTGPGKVAVDAKNFAAIFGTVAPTATGDILTAAVTAYGQVQKMGTANLAKAKALAEARLFGSWQKRFKEVNGQFTGASGFKHIVQCMKLTFESTATAPTDDSNAGASGWAVYSRVSAATKAKLRAAIVEQMTASTSAL